MMTLLPDLALNSLLSRIVFPKELMIFLLVRISGFDPSADTSFCGGVEEAHFARCRPQADTLTNSDSLLGACPYDDNRIANSHVNILVLAQGLDYAHRAIKTISPSGWSDGQMLR